MQSTIILNPAGPGDRTTPVNWPALHADLPLRGGKTGRYFGRCIITGKHRVGVLNRLGSPEKPSYDYWLLDDAGRCRCSPGPSDYDFAPSEQVPA